MQRYDYEHPYESTQDVVVTANAETLVNFDRTLRPENREGPCGDFHSAQQCWWQCSNGMWDCFPLRAHSPPQTPMQRSGKRYRHRFRATSAPSSGIWNVPCAVYSSLMGAPVPASDFRVDHRPGVVRAFWPRQRVRCVLAACASRVRPCRWSSSSTRTSLAPPCAIDCRIPGAVRLILTVRNLDSIPDRVKAQGASVVTVGGARITLRNHNAGRAVMIQDPDGFYIQLMQPNVLPETNAPPATSNVIGASFGLTINVQTRRMKVYRDLLGFKPEIESTFTTDKATADLMNTPGAQMRRSVRKFPDRPWTWSLWS